MKYLLLLLVALAAAAPYGAGMLIEKQYNTAIANLNTANDGNLKFIGTFNKGFLESHATTQIINIANNQSVTLQHTIHNGPVILKFKDWLDVNSYIPQGYKLAVIDTTVDADFIKILQGFYKQGQALKIMSEIAYNGDGITMITNDPLTMPIGPGILKWGGLNIELKHDKDFINLSTALKIPSANYKENVDGTKEINLGSLNFNFTQQILTMDANGDGQLADFYLKENDVEVASLNKANVSFKQQVINKLASTELNYGFDKLKLDQHVIGPFALNFKLKNINVEVLKSISKLQKPGQGKTSIPPEKFNELFASKPSLDFNFNLQTSKGSMVVVANIVTTAKQIKQLDAQAFKECMNSTVSTTFDELLFYALLSYFAQEDLKNKEMTFAIQNPKATKNPYTLSDSEAQAKIEAWMMILLDQLRNNNWIVEKNKKINIDFKLDNNILVINGANKTDDDFKRLEPFLNISTEQIPAPETQLKPEIVPAQPQQQQPASPSKETVPQD